MDAFRITQRPHQGKLTIVLPDELANQEVEVIVRPLHPDRAAIESDIAEIRALWGIGKDLDVDLTDEDYYNQ